MSSSQHPGFAYPTYTAMSSESSQSQQTTQPAAGSSTSTQPVATQSRQAAEEARKDRTLADFMLMLDEYEPLVCCNIMFLENFFLIFFLDPKRSDRLLSPTRWL